MGGRYQKNTTERAITAEQTGGIVMASKMYTVVKDREELGKLKNPDRREETGGC